MSTYSARAAGAIAAAGAALATMLALAPGSALAATNATVSNRTLQVTGDRAGDFLGVFQDATTVVLDVGENGSPDFTFDRSTFDAIRIDAGGGDDEVRILNAAQTDKTITVDGGAGDDTLIGGNSAETLIGGAGNDFVDGNIGADTARLGAGADRFQWDPGDGSDTVEGDSGQDALDFNGSNIGEDIDISANGPRVRLFRNVAAITMDFAGIDTVNVRALGGADNVTVGDLAGTDLDETDVDLAATGGGSDGSADRVIANGTAGADAVKVDSPDGKVRVTRAGRRVVAVNADPAQDRVAVNTLAGADTITSGVGLTGAQAVDVDGGPDADQAFYNGTAGDDVVGIARDGVASVATFAADGTPFEVAAVEDLNVNGLAGADTITGQNGIGQLTSLDIEGDEGADQLRGGDGNDLIRGGDGADFLDGNIGSDVLRGGDGDDRIQWDPGDGSDTVEGRADDDTLDFNGSNIGEDIDVSADEGHVRLTRNVAAIAMDIDGVEHLRLRVLGGADAINVDSLAHTDMRSADVDLTAFDGQGDATNDTVTVGGTSRADTVAVTRDGGRVIASGLAAETRISGSDGPADVLNVDTFGGNDEVTIAPDVGALITPFVHLGAGE